MEDSYWEMMKSSIADMVNTGGRPGGSITAALFLKQVGNKSDHGYGHVLRDHPQPPDILLTMADVCRSLSTKTLPGLILILRDLCGVMRRKAQLGLPWPPFLTGL